MRLIFYLNILNCLCICLPLCCKLLLYRLGSTPVFPLQHLPSALHRVGVCHLMTDEGDITWKVGEDMSEQWQIQNKQHRQHICPQASNLTQDRQTEVEPWLLAQGLPIFSSNTCHLPRGSPLASLPARLPHLHTSSFFEAEESRSLD